MKNPHTKPVPLDPPHAAAGGGALRWLTARLKARPAPAASKVEGDSAGPNPDTNPLGAFPPAVGRGHALRLAHGELRRLLARQPAARIDMPHLAHLERTLAKHGSRALMKLPASVLQGALEQLERAQGDAPHAALAVLRTRLVETIALRSVTDTPSMRGVLWVPPGLEVREATHSQFNEAERNWSGPMPLHSGSGNAGT